MISTPAHKAICQENIRKVVNFFYNAKVYSLALFFCLVFSNILQEIDPPSVEILEEEIIGELRNLSLWCNNTVKPYRSWK